MNRVRNSAKNIKKRKKLIKQAKGYFGSKHKLKKTAKEQIMRSQRYSYIGRKEKKRMFKSIWINRINIACRNNKKYKLNYSTFMRFLKLSQIRLNRKTISEMIIKEPELFDKLLEKIKNPWEKEKAMTNNID